jgi:hypothetical protein
MRTSPSRLGKVPGESRAVQPVGPARRKKPTGGLLRVSTGPINDVAWEVMGQAALLAASVHLQRARNF